MDRWEQICSVIPGQMLGLNVHCPGLMAGCSLLYCELQQLALMAQCSPMREWREMCLWIFQSMGFVSVTFTPLFVPVPEYD